jgi:hypothetical protein
VPELLVSAPDAGQGRGAVFMTYGQDFGEFSNQDVDSIPRMETQRNPFYPIVVTLVGAEFGDEFGFATDGGDVNSDGNRDILCGAPGADRDGLVDSGVIYVIYGRIDFGGGVDIQETNAPRMEIRGTRSGQRYGEIQTLIGNVDNDAFPDDIGFASPYAGADGPGGPESGFIGILLARNQLTGENIFYVDEVGGPHLAGVRIYGRQPGGHAGTVINGGGDYNRDGKDDLIIVAPDETRRIGNLEHRGVAYVIFGGEHLYNMTFDLGQVGSDEVPGVVFVSPYPVGSADEAPITWADFAGDVNADGFDDILIGLETADYVYPLAPSQRRIDTGECYLIYGSNSGGNSF